MTPYCCPHCSAARNTTKRGTLEYRGGTWTCGSTARTRTAACYEKQIARLQTYRAWVEHLARTRFRTEATVDAIRKIVGSTNALATERAKE